MIYEVQERRYVLKRTSGKQCCHRTMMVLLIRDADYERLLLLFTSGVLQLDRDSGNDSEDPSKKRWDCVRV